MIVGKFLLKFTDNKLAARCKVEEPGLDIFV